MNGVEKEDKWTCRRNTTEKTHNNEKDMDEAAEREMEEER